MFKPRFLLLVSSLIVLMNAAPIDTESEAKIIKDEFTIDKKGNYRFSFETSNGLTREETGSIVNEGQPNEHIEVVGRYTYFDTEGQREVVEYSAGENGYNILPPPALKYSEIKNIIRESHKKLRAFSEIYAYIGDESVTLKGIDNSKLYNQNNLDEIGLPPSVVASLLGK